jgi:hypothetical protein
MNSRGRPYGSDDISGPPERAHAQQQGRTESSRNEEARLGPTAYNERPALGDVYGEKHNLYVLPEAINKPRSIERAADNFDQSPSRNHDGDVLPVY